MLGSAMLPSVLYTAKRRRLARPGGTQSSICDECQYRRLSLLRYLTAKQPRLIAPNNIWSNMYTRHHWPKVGRLFRASGHMPWFRPCSCLIRRRWRLQPRRSLITFRPKQQNSSSSSSSSFLGTAFASSLLFTLIFETFRFSFCAAWEQSLISLCAVSRRGRHVVVSVGRASAIAEVVSRV